MIPLTTGPEPPVLAANREAWGQEYAEALANGASAPARYRSDDIRDALRLETFGKCAYCESYIEHISFAHIEHILPKSVWPQLVCAWENLTLACARCNSNKGAYYSEDVPLLNPYTDAVDDHISFHGPMAIHRTDSAKFSITKLQLNRPELLFRREGVLRSILQILDLFAKTTGEPAMQAALMEDLAQRLLASAEYANCARCFAYDEGATREIPLPEI